MIDHRGALVFFLVESGQGRSHASRALYFTTRWPLLPQTTKTEAQEAVAAFCLHSAQIAY